MILICQFADFELTVEGSTFDRVCCQCGVRLMMAPSGQALVMREPAIRLLCIPCGVAEINAAEGEPVTLARLPIDDVIREAATVRPNMRRHRN